MLHTIFVISNDYVRFKNGMPADRKCKIYFSFFTDGSNKEALLKAYQFFSKNEIANFSLSLKINDAWDEVVIEDVIAFFFIPTYYQVMGELILSVICNEDLVFEDAKKRLIDLANTHGIKNLTVRHVKGYENEIAKPITSGIKYSPVFFDQKVLLAEYVTLFNTEKKCDRVFYLKDFYEDISSMYRMFQRAEEEMKLQYPQLYMMAIDMQLLSIENAHMTKVNEYVTDELNNYKAHVEILSSSHEAKTLQLYYDKEYEILPLWYKQFGHIIKVIMGKRSFRSLFDNNVKKSKD
jgi:hypothetical protein